MRENNLIQSEDKKYSLNTGFVEGDVLLVLQGKGVQLPLRFSSLMRLSLGRPWDYLPLDLIQVKFDINGATLNVSGRSAELEAAASFTFKGNALHCGCFWQALSDLKDAGVAFVVELEHEMKTEKVTLPMSIYNDNPAIDPAVIAPHFPRTAGASFLAEESKYPIPCAHVEWKEDGNPRYVSLFCIPDLNDKTGWSLGVNRAKGDGIEIMAASGSVSFNGRKDENYGSKNAAVRVESGYLNLKKGEALAKSFALRLDLPAAEGQGFRDIVRTGYELFKPVSSPALTLDEALALKTEALNERWHEDKDCAGFLCVAPDNIYLRPPYFLWGWTGQSFRMALCSAREGFESGNKEYVERAKKCAAFFFKGSRTKTKGLHYNRYMVNDKKWLGEAYFKEDRFSSRALGETFWNLSKLILLFLEKKEPVPAEWIEGLTGAADFFSDPANLLSEGIPPLMWFGDGKPASPNVSSAGSACISAILGAFKVTGEEKYRKAAEKMLEIYWRTGGDKFDTPFSKATLDSGCEDKEAAVPFFAASADLFYMTGSEKYKEWALVSGDWLLTWVYFRELKFKPDSILAKHGFKATGWPAVSVENQHLDVFFPAYEMYEFGEKAGEPLFMAMGKLIFEAFSHGISKGKGDWFFDKPGRQGEQFMHTRWGFNPKFANYPEKFRKRFEEEGYTGESLGVKVWDGGYNPWDTSWIIVMVLEAAQRFKYNA